MPDQRRNTARQRAVPGNTRWSFESRDQRVEFGIRYATVVQRNEPWKRPRGHRSRTTTDPLEPII